MMTNIEKNQIVEKLNSYITRMGSQKKAANSLKGVSVRKLNSMVNGRHEKITDHLKKRIKSGVKLNKRGYKEIFSRLGRRFMSLKGVSLTDLVQICETNRIEKSSAQDRKSVKDLFEETQGDLRLLKRRIHTVKSILVRTNTNGGLELLLKLKYYEKDHRQRDTLHDERQS